MKQLIALLALLGIASTSWAAPQHGIEAHDPWVREAPPGAKVLAAYLQLHNHGSTLQTLISVDAPAFARVELHRTADMGGMASMAGMSQVMIPGHGKVAFEPGSLHIMLIDPISPLVAGDNVHIILHFKDGSSLPIDAEVRRDIIGGKAHHHGTHAPTETHIKHDHGH